MLINAFDFMLEIFGIDFIARCWVLKVRLHIAIKITFDYKATYFLDLQACLQTLKIRVLPYPAFFWSPSRMGRWNITPSERGVKLGSPLKKGLKALFFAGFARSEPLRLDPVFPSLKGGISHAKNHLFQGWNPPPKPSYYWSRHHPLLRSDEQPTWNLLLLSLQVGLPKMEWAGFWRFLP